jgi:hypothetical protein
MGHVTRVVDERDVAALRVFDTRDAHDVDTAVAL